MNKDEIKARLKNLQAWTKGALGKVDAAGDSDAEAILGPLVLETAVKDFVELLEPEPIKFEDFVKQISQGLISAQEQLDAKSADYLQSIAGKSHILPSIFRVPKISAEMRFGLKVEKNQGINLLFFSKRDQTQSMNEQAIDFEVVSVPAPAGAAQQLMAMAPAMDLVLDPVLRQEVMGGVANATISDDDNGAKPLVVAAGDPKISPRLVILEFYGESNRPRRYLLCYALEDADKSVGLWLLIMDKKPLLQTIYKLTTDNGFPIGKTTSEKALRDLILELGNRLEKLT